MADAMGRMVAVATWPFGAVGVRAAAECLLRGECATSAVVVGVSAVELDESVTSVGYGGLPNECGELELDAAIMDGASGASGAVMALTHCKSAILPAWLVMQHCEHTVLVGDGAARFVVQQLLSNPALIVDSHQDVTREQQSAQLRDWIQRNKPQWSHVEMERGLKAPLVPASAHHRHEHTGEPAAVLHMCLADDADALLTPHARRRLVEYLRHKEVDSGAHSDTVGLICMDSTGSLSVGCATSGRQFKRCGRVGDSPMVGHGLYADNAAGAATCSGDGDHIIRFCLSFCVVELMRGGLSVQAACEHAARRILTASPSTQAAVLAVEARTGAVGAYATRENFTFARWSGGPMDAGATAGASVEELSSSSEGFRAGTATPLVEILPAPIGAQDVAEFQIQPWKHTCV